MGGRLVRAAFLIAVLAGAPGIFTGKGEAEAFSRGLASKARQMRSNSYKERAENAKQAFKEGRFADCVREGELALQHAANDDQARPLHKLLVLSYGRLGREVLARTHQDWLAQHPEAF